MILFSSVRDPSAGSQILHRHCTGWSDGNHLILFCVLYELIVDGRLRCVHQARSISWRL